MNENYADLLSINKPEVLKVEIEIIENENISIENIDEISGEYYLLLSGTIDENICWRLDLEEVSGFDAMELRALRNGTLVLEMIGDAGKIVWKSTNPSFDTDSCILQFCSDDSLKWTTDSKNNEMQPAKVTALSKAKVENSLINKQGIFKQETLKNYTCIIQIKIDRTDALTAIENQYILPQIVRHRFARTFSTQVFDGSTIKRISVMQISSNSYTYWHLQIFFKDDIRPLSFSSSKVEKNGVITFKETANTENKYSVLAEIQLKENNKQEMSILDEDINCVGCQNNCPPYYRVNISGIANGECEDCELLIPPPDSDDAIVPCGGETGYSRYGNVCGYTTTYIQGWDPLCINGERISALPVFIEGGSEPIVATFWGTVDDCNGSISLDIIAWSGPCDWSSASATLTPIESMIPLADLGSSIRASAHFGYNAGDAKTCALRGVAI